MRTALLAGSTGLIGRQLLQLLLESSRYSKVIALTRHDLPGHPRLVQVRTEFGELREKAHEIKADDVFCCLGTTMEKAGSKKNFYKVDFEYPLQLAKITNASGAKQFLLVSALGANKKSGIYYNRVKGEIEEAILQVGFETVHIFRPSLLRGRREEKRAGERAAQLLYRIVGFLIPKKYKAIDSLKVANAMLSLAAQEQKGVFIHESIQLQGF